MVDVVCGEQIIEDVDISLVPNLFKVALSNPAIVLKNLGVRRRFSRVQTTCARERTHDKEYQPTCREFST
jgi:hypothetical protein